MISIHAPRVGSDYHIGAYNVDTGISIHAPRVGSDLQGFRFRGLMSIFQSTLPVWGATKQDEIVFKGRMISIHAPRVGSDLCIGVAILSVLDFNPRSPCGERP